MGPPADAAPLALPAPAASPAPGEGSVTFARAWNPERVAGFARTAALLLGVWSIPGIVSTIQVHFFFDLHQPLGFGQVFLFQMLPWLWMAPMTPFVAWVARRYRLTWGNLRRALPAHLAASLVFTTIDFVIAHQAGVWAGVRVFEQRGLLEGIGRLYKQSLHLEQMSYWGIVAVTYAFCYHKQLQDERVASAELETKLARAQLDALKMQLQPHFLFNTLHAVGVLVRKNDAPGSIRMLTGIGDLLRITLDNVGRHEVPLKQELDFLDRYLDVEKTRFQDRLAVRRDVDPSALDASFPNLLLQPIVENAIRHGVEARADGGTVTITARRERGNARDRLVVVVQDDGPGLSAARAPARPGSGVGLRNVRARLEQMYPGTHSFAIEEVGAAPGVRGVRVTVSIPFVRLEGAGERQEQEAQRGER